MKNRFSPLECCHLYVAIVICCGFFFKWTLGSDVGDQYMYEHRRKCRQWKLCRGEYCLKLRICLKKAFMAWFIHRPVCAIIQRLEKIKEGLDLYPWSQCKKTKQNPNPKIKHTNPHMFQYKKNMLKYVVCTSAHNTNTELCYHSIVLLQSLPYILRAPSLSFLGKK